MARGGTDRAGFFEYFRQDEAGIAQGLVGAEGGAAIPWADTQGRVPIGVTLHVGPFDSRPECLYLASH